MDRTWMAFLRGSKSSVFRSLSNCEATLAGVDDDPVVVGVDPDVVDGVDNFDGEDRSYASEEKDDCVNRPPCSFQGNRTCR